MGRTTLNGGEPEGLAKRLASLGGLDGESLKERWAATPRHGCVRPA